MAEKLETSVYIEEDNASGVPLRFEFFSRELPEEIPFPIAAKLNEIEYPGGHKTNQIIGTYWQEIEWTGLFYGTYPDNKVAWDRMLYLRDMVGKVVRVGFPVPGYSGFKGLFVLKELTPKVRNYLNIEYSLKLVPHERQEKVKPKESANVMAKFDARRLEDRTNSFKDSTKKQDVAQNLSETSRYLRNIYSINDTTPKTPW